MPSRKFPLMKGYYYHVFNRGLNRQPTFTVPREYARAMTGLWYYRYHTSRSLHSYLGLAESIRTEIGNKLEQKDERYVDIVSYCLMPNHFHLLIKQLEEGGISKFVGIFQNSFTRYFNKKRNLQGGLFIPQFKAVLVETDEQLLHLSRYIHINPYASAVVNSLEGLLDFPYSSFAGILGKRKDNILSDVDVILSNFKTSSDYKQFVINQADYQAKLNNIKHLILEK